MNWSKLTLFAKSIIVLLVAGAIGFLVYHFSPGLRVGESKQVQGLDISDKDVNNVASTSEISLPSTELSPSRHRRLRQRSVRPSLIADPFSSLGGQSVYLHRS